MSSSDTDCSPCKFLDENMQAEKELESGNYPEAARIMVQILDNDPMNWRAINNMGILSWSKGKWNDAYTMFKRAVSIKPDYEDALVNLFDAALKLRRVSEIEHLYCKALEINPSLEDIRVIYESMVAMKETIYQSKRALSLGFHSEYIEVAEKLLEEGKYYEAMNKFLQSNDVDGPNSKAYCGLGIISFYQQRYHDAYSLFIESIRQNPSDEETYLNLLDAAKEIGKTEIARDIYNIYRKEFPELEKISSNFDFL